MPRIIVGVATLPSRWKFFSTKVLPNLREMADEVWVYTDNHESPDLVRYFKLGTSLEPCPPISLGDAGKFLGAERCAKLFPDHYYFSCDDDLIYPLGYVARMIEWIEYLNKKAVVSLHGSSFSSPLMRRVLFPGTGTLAYHSSLLRVNVAEHFLARNMADIWMGKLLQEQKAPAVVIPHAGTYLTYDNSLPLEDTIWGQEVKRDFLQTAIVNQLSLDPGLQLFPLQITQPSEPQALSPAPQE